MKDFESDTVLDAEVRTFGLHTVEVRTLGGLYSAVDTNLDDALKVLEDRVARRYPGVVLRPRLIAARPYGGWGYPEHFEGSSVEPNPVLQRLIALASYTPSSNPDPAFSCRPEPHVVTALLSSIHCESRLAGDVPLNTAVGIGTDPEMSYAALCEKDPRASGLPVEVRDASVEINE